MNRRILTPLLVLAALALPGTSAAAEQCTSSGTIGVCLSPPAAVSGDVVIAPTSTTGVLTRVNYTLDGLPLLIAFDPPYAFTWPTARYAGNGHVLGVSATGGAVTTAETTFPITIAPGGAAPPLGTFVPRHGTTPSAGRPFTLAGGGDGAGGEASATAVTDMIASWSPNMMLYLGDVYDNGTIAEFYNWYGEATHRWFDRFKSITNPVIGNHEYDSLLGPDPLGYRGYWGAGAEDMYTVDVAGWHLIALNSNAQIGPARIANEIAKLRDDLAKTPASQCTLAYFHHPVQNAGPEGEPGAGSLPGRLWSELAGKADIVLNGHDHSYQRFKPVSGTTELVIGTTGHSGQAPVPDPRLVTFFGDLFGALRAELNPHGFGFRFIDEDGVVLDSGAIPCAAAHDTAAPATPTGLVEGDVSRTTAEILWQTPTDDVGVTGYDVLRDGVVIGSTAGGTRFVDSSVQAGTASTYRVRARDGAGHLSAPSTPLVVLPSSVVFLDTFESGNLAAWTTRVGAVAVTPAAAHLGAGGLHVSATGGLAYVSKTLVTTFGTLEALVHVRTAAPSQVNLVTFADGAGVRIVTVYKQNGSGKLCYSVGQLPGTVTTKCQTNVPIVRFDNGAWHVLRVRASTGGSPALTIRLDDAPVPGLDGSPPLGANPIARLLVGANVPNQAFQADFDQVAADPLPIGDLNPPTPPAALSAKAVSGLQVNVAWAASADDVGVAGYLVFRNGLPVGTTAGTGFIDRTVDGLASYAYTVRARDAVGNVSAPSPAASVDTPIVLRERFDTAASLKRFAPAGGLGWNAPSKALRLRSNAHGRIALPGATSRLYARIKFRIVTRGATAVPLLSLRSATGAVLSTGLDASGAVGATRPASAQWHDLQIHADVATRVSQVFLDGEERTELTRQLPAGLPAITAIELGGAGTFDVLVDDLEANTAFMTDTVRPAAPRVSAKIVRSHTVSLSWTAAKDDVGVAGYRILRGAVEIGRTTGKVRTFVDRAATPGARLTYGVRAVDAAGNLSATAKQVVRVPWLAASRRRLVRAKRSIRLTLPAAHRSVVLTLRVRPRTTPGRTVVARLGATHVRFPKSARARRWITIRVRVKRPGTVLRLGGTRSFDVARVVVQ